MPGHGSPERAGADPGRLRSLRRGPGQGRGVAAVWAGAGMAGPRARGGCRVGRGGHGRAPGRGVAAVWAGAGMAGPPSGACCRCLRTVEVHVPDRPAPVEVQAAQPGAAGQHGRQLAPTRPPARGGGMNGGRVRGGPGHVLLSPLHDARWHSCCRARMRCALCTCVVLGAEEGGGRQGCARRAPVCVCGGGGSTAQRRAAAPTCIQTC
jgi:hypothetical protein